MILSDIQSIIANRSAVMLYFYNDVCTPCKILRPKVRDMVEVNFPKIDFRVIYAEQFPAISAQFGVFASPTILVFFEGKEYIRVSKNIV